MSKTIFALTWATVAVIASAVQALTIPYTEDFTADNAAWRTNSSPVFMTFAASDGPDGSSYVSAPFNFENNLADDAVVIHRANPGASGDNFFGNWMADGGKELRAYVRHNAPVPLNYFLRAATPAGFPGFIIGNTSFVQPNTWTPIEFTINAQNPISFPEGQPFENVFSNVGRVQLGVFVPAGLVGVDQNFAFDLDQVTVDVPEPGTLSLVIASLAGVLACGRNRTSLLHNSGTP